MLDTKFARLIRRLSRDSNACALALFQMVPSQSLELAEYKQSINDAFDIGDSQADFRPHFFLLNLIKFCK